LLSALILLRLVILVLTVLVLLRLIVFVLSGILILVLVVILLIVVHKNNLLYKTKLLCTEKINLIHFLLLHEQKYYVIIYQIFY